MNYSQYVNNKVTPQSQPIPGEQMIQNSAGGFVYELDKWATLNRFLILGSEGGTYYAGEKELTITNATNLVDCIKEDGERVVKTVIDISQNTRAPKNDPAIFALAMVKAHGDAKAKAALYQAIPMVCRTGTHLFQFCQAIQDTSSWSAGLRRSVGNWYTKLPVNKLELQLIKYRQRNGWTHKDVLRLAHAKTKDEELNKLLKYAVGKVADPISLGGMVGAYEQLTRPGITVKEALPLIQEFRLPWEAIPTDMTKDTKIWEALLPNMGYTAMMRNLAKMTSIGLLKTNLDTHTKFICEKLAHPEGERVHPMAILLAMKTYAAGRGHKGSLTWMPVQKITDTLNDAFYAAFKNVTPTNKNLLLAVDVSGSMNCAQIANTSLTAREASAALALVTANVEPNYEIRGFSDTFVNLDISPKMRLDTVIRNISRLPFARTDCALPMLWASENKIPVDAFFVYTDNETWCGNIHPSQALRNYRKQFVKDAKLCVMAMTPTKFTIADPKDRGMLDFVGFDASAPQLMSEFVMGNI